MDCCVGEGGFLGFDDIDVESIRTLLSRSSIPAG